MDGSREDQDERGEVEDLGDRVGEQEDGPVEVVRHVDQLGQGEERERGPQDSELALVGQPRKSRSERKSGDVDDQEEPGRELVDPVSIRHKGLLSSGV